MANLSASIARARSLLGAVRRPAPPDGGALAWLCVASGFGFYAIGVGFQYAMGVVLSAILQDAAIVGDLSRAQVSWVSSVESAMFLFGSLPCALIRPHLGIRGTALLGGALFVGGALVAASASSMPVVVLGFGILGLGCSFPATVALTALQLWFFKNRGMASGIVVCGSGVGAVILGPLIQQQVDIGGWRRAMLFVALLGGALIPLCTVFTIPMELDAPAPPAVLPAAEAAAAAEAGEQPAAPAAAAAAAAEAPALPAAARQWVDWPAPPEDDDAPLPADGKGSPAFDALRRNQPFLCFLAFIALYGGCWFALIAHFNSSARETGTSADDAALLVSFQGACNILGRLAMGFLADRLSARGVPLVALVQINVFVMAAFTAALAFPPLLGSRAFQVVYAMVNGGFGGSIPSLQAPIVVDLVGLKALPLAFGLIHAVQAPLVLVAPVAAGALRAASGSWVLVWAAVGATVAAAASCLSLMRGLPETTAPLTLVGIAAWAIAKRSGGAKPLALS